jgi:hypothetical protein
MAAKCSGGDPALGKLAFNLGVADLQNGVHVSAAQSFVGPAKSLHVLLRHRPRSIAASIHGRGWFRTSDLSRVKR